MFLDNYFSENSASQISFTRKQASDFAKDIADDFNPIHDQDAKRFCVPGDLLFSTVLRKYGLSENMQFDFLGLVTDDVTLGFPESDEGKLVISGDNGKDYLAIIRDGEIHTDKQKIAKLIRQYVAFSGQTFPHILVPLMEQNEMMINPDRPLVIYERMMIHFNHFNFDDLTLKMTFSKMKVDGKRGNVSLRFILQSDDEVVGTGEKNMVLSGLRSYEEEKIGQLTQVYNTRKNKYLKLTA
ncbi:MAG: DUF3581 domain-containing protein [Gammaproteobacteria bacterium]|nr:DUF3581 domain-containing protein [Gammaproteobacteria bacterium]